MLAASASAQLLLHPDSIHFQQLNAAAGATGTELELRLCTLPASRCAPAKSRNAGDPQQQRVKPYENRDGNHQAVQARRGARSAHRRRHSGPDRHRSQRLRASEGTYGNLSRRRIRRELPAEDQDRGRGRHRTSSTRPSRRSPRRPRPARSATARSSSVRSTTPCASAPAKPTPTRFEQRHRIPMERSMNIPTRLAAGGAHRAGGHARARRPRHARRLRAGSGARRGRGCRARCARLHRRQGRHHLDADLHRARAADDHPRPRAVLRRPGARQEHALGADAGLHHHRRGDDRLGRSTATASPSPPATPSSAASPRCSWPAST